MSIISVVRLISDIKKISMAKRYHFLSFPITRIMVLKGIWVFPSDQDRVIFGHIAVLLTLTRPLAPPNLSTRLETLKGPLV